MSYVRALVLVVLISLASSSASFGQQSDLRERILGIPERIPPPAPLPGPQGFQEHIVDGKLVLTLDDAIRLAMANNIDIRVDQATVDFAKNNVYRQSALFDPLASASFVDQRVKTQTSSQLQGAAVLNTLSQTTQFGYAQTFPTGTNFQTFFGNLKSSTNSGFATLNPF